MIDEEDYGRFMNCPGGTCWKAVRSRVLLKTFRFGCMGVVPGLAHRHEKSGASRPVHLASAALPRMMPIFSTLA